MVATLVPGSANGGGGGQRVQHRRVSIAEYGEYVEYPAAAPPTPPVPRQHPQQIEVQMHARNPSHSLCPIEFLSSSFRSG